MTDRLHAQIHPRVMQDYVNLGLATTRQMLDEIAARGRTWPTDTPDMHALRCRCLAVDMARAAETLLAELPADVLDYRTVDQ